MKVVDAAGIKHSGEERPVAVEVAVERWLDYLERDRHIGAAWPSGDGFTLSPLATRAFRL